MEITRTSMMTGITRTKFLDVTPEEIDRWYNGAYVQDVWPHLSADDREFIMTGMTAEEWDQI